MDSSAGSGAAVAGAREGEGHERCDRAVRYSKTSGLAIIAGPDVSHDEVSAVASILEVIANPEQARLGLREILWSRRSEDQIEGQEKILGEGVEKHRRNHHQCHTPIQK